MYKQLKYNSLHCYLSGILGILMTADIKKHTFWNLWWDNKYDYNWNLLGIHAACWSLVHSEIYI